MNLEKVKTFARVDGNKITTEMMLQTPEMTPQFDITTRQGNESEYI